MNTRDLFREAIANIPDDIAWEVDYKDVTHCVGDSFESLKSFFEKWYGVGNLPDDLLIDAEIEDELAADMIIDFTGTIKDAVQIRSWDELARFYADDSIEKNGFRVSWVKEIHSSVPWKCKLPSGEIFYF